MTRTVTVRDGESIFLCVAVAQEVPAFMVHHRLRHRPKTSRVQAWVCADPHDPIGTRFGDACDLGRPSGTAGQHPADEPPEKTLYDSAESAAVAVKESLLARSQAEHLGLLSARGVGLVYSRQTAHAMVGDGIDLRNTAVVSFLETQGYSYTKFGMESPPSVVVEMALAIHRNP